MKILRLWRNGTSDILINTMQMITGYEDVHKKVQKLSSFNNYYKITLMGSGINVKL